MAEKRLKKQRPAGKNDSLEVAYTNFASNERKTELKVEGKEFDNDELLRMLGFQDKDGVMTLSTSEYDAEIAPNGEIIRRKKNGRVLTENKQAEAER